MQAVVLTGGLATRLGERVRELPKYLLEVAGRPFADWQLDRIAACGFEEVVLCVGHLAGAIEERLGSRHGSGLRLRYSHDGPTLLGTGGALRNAMPMLQSTFLMTYGDSYLPFDYQTPLRELEAHADALACMSVYRNHDLLDRSNTRVDDGWVTAYDKTRPPGEPPPQDIDYGAIALRREVLERRAVGRFDLAELLGALVDERRVRAVRAEQRFYEIGSEAGLSALDHELESHPEAHPDHRRGAA
jgi:NDP-sugar pyrophosphorylase family protein